MTKEWKDQLAHAGYAVVALLPIALYPHPVTGFIGGYALGFLREITEEGSISWRTIKRAAWGKDMVTWSVTGTLIGGIAHALVS